MTNRLTFWCCCYPIKLHDFASIYYVFNTDITIFILMNALSVVGAIMSKRYETDFTFGFLTIFMLVHIIWSFIIRFKLVVYKENNTLNVHVVKWLCWRKVLFIMLYLLQLLYIGALVYYLLATPWDEEGISENNPKVTKK